MTVFHATFPGVSLLDFMLTVCGYPIMLLSRECAMHM